MLIASRCTSAKEDNSKSLSSVPRFRLWSAIKRNGQQDEQRGRFVAGVEINEQSNRALMVLASSPVLLRASTRNLPPSISPTLRSLSPVAFEAFLDLKLGSADESISGGGLSDLTLGILLVFVDVVLLIC
jgi:hypothetical protein